MGDFAQSFNGALVGTLLGGCLSGYLIYYFNRRFLCVSATHDLVRKLISQEMSDKRLEIKSKLKEIDQKELCDCVDHRSELYSLKRKIIDLLNEYEIIMGFSEEGIYSQRIIRSSIWAIIADDVKLLNGFIAEYDKKVTGDEERPFNVVRRYAHNWK